MGEEPFFIHFFRNGGIYLSTKEIDRRSYKISMSSSLDTINFVRETCESLYNTSSFHSLYWCVKENEFLLKRVNGSIWTSFWRNERIMNGGFIWTNSEILIRNEPQVSFPKERNRSKERKGFPKDGDWAVYCCFDGAFLSVCISLFSGLVGIGLGPVNPTALPINPGALDLEQFKFSSFPAHLQLNRVIV